MIEQKPSTIEEAPSLADIAASSSKRVGTVDFTATLAGDAGQDGWDSDKRDPKVVALSSMVRPTRPSGEAESDLDDGPRMPFILPPAKVDAVMAAEAERTRQEIAAARGELPEVDDEDELENEHGDEDGDEEAPEVDAEPDAAGPVIEPVAEPAEMARLAARASAEEVVSPVEPAATVQHVEPAQPVGLEKTPTPVVSSGPPEGLVIQDVADLEKVAALAAEAAALAEAEAEQRRQLEEQTRAEAAAAVAEEAAVQAAAEESERAARAAEITVQEQAHAGFEAATELPVPIDAVLEVDADEDDESDGPVRSVAEVAATVIAAMRTINETHERHLESIELETARRCELLTAQAELDAELIRLHARREAHAIISAARMRSGEHDAGLVETDQLGEIGETFSRFAETIETTVTSGPESPDHLRKP